MKADPDVNMTLRFEYFLMERAHKYEAGPASALVAPSVGPPPAAGEG